MQEYLELLTAMTSHESSTRMKEFKLIQQKNFLKICLKFQEIS
jgi:hypothetical protein